MSDKKTKPILREACLECEEEDCLACRRDKTPKNPKTEKERRGKDGLDRSS